MAYAFDRLTNLVGGEKSDESNIFGGAQAGSDPSNTTSNTSAPKTDTSGDLGGANSSSIASAGGTVGKSAPQNTDNSAYAVNYGKAGIPQGVKDAQVAVGNQQTALQNEANTYTANTAAAAPKYAVDSGTLDKAVGGDADAMKSVTGTLNTTTAAPVDAFIPKTSTYVAQGEDLQTDAGLKHLISGRMGPNYTPGMANFDLGMLKGSQPFSSLVDAVKGGYSNLNTDRNGYVLGGDKDLTKTAQDARQKSLVDAQTGVRTALGQSQAEIVAAQEKAAKDANDMLWLTQHGGVNTDSHVQDLVNQAKAAAEAERAGSGGLVGNSAINPFEYLKFHDKYNAADFATADQASKYNNISSLLGLGGPMQQAGAGAGDSYTWDDQGLMDSLHGGYSSGLERRDANDNTSFQSIMDAINGTAGGVNSGRNEGVPTNQGILDQVKAGLGNVDPNNLIDLSKYITASGAVGANDIMTADQAAKLNEIATRLGKPAIYKAGAGAGENFVFDKDRYTQDLAAAQKQYDTTHMHTEVPPSPNAYKGKGGKPIDPESRQPISKPSSASDVVDSTVLPELIGAQASDNVKTAGRDIANETKRVPDNLMGALGGISDGIQSKWGGSTSSDVTGGSSGQYKGKGGKWIADTQDEPFSKIMNSLKRGGR